MVRRRKDVDWAAALRLEDFAIVQQRIDIEAWYPMTTFEHLGLAILSHFEGGLDAVRLWGSFSASSFAQQHPGLIAAGDPVETLMRLKVLRTTLFDFSAFDVPTLIDGHAMITMQYEMGAVAEEAACHQTLGFCEGVVGLAGGRAIRGGFGERSWLGAPRTVVALDWENPVR
jgi:hypothetical protein